METKPKNSRKTKNISNEISNTKKNNNIDLQTEQYQTTQRYPKMIDRRIQQLRFNMQDEKIEAAWITHLPNIRYLTNFSGSFATLLVTFDELHFFTDDRYEEQIKTELFPVLNLVTHITRNPLETVIKNKLLKNISKIGIESEYISFEDGLAVRSQANTQKVKMCAIQSLVEKYTQPKSPEEISNIKESCRIAELVYEKMLGIIKPGITEVEIAAEISYQTRKLGSEGDAFDIICVAGSRSALVHGSPTTAKVKKNDIVLMDFGCKINGFCSDISRTVCVGKPTAEQKKIYDILYNAMSAAIKEVRPAMRGNYLDAIARDLIKAEGYGENFQHSLGHGLGLVCHEKPIISFRLTDQIIPEDVVLAIEPGIYLPNKFGMRVEDNILVTKTGAIKLTNAPSELVCI